MDFLDPTRKKAHRRRLLAGYLLVAVAVAMGTLILLFSAYGWDVNRKTGDVIQNGTVFVDSQPGGSLITLNGEEQRNRTASRLVMPGSRQYTIKLSQDGYRDWERTFSLEGGKIERIVYPVQLPNKLKTVETQLYATAPELASQSPDRRWLLVQQPAQTYVFDLFDLNNPTAAASTIIIPRSILTEADKPATVRIVEWANDNRRVIIERTHDGKLEFLMIDINAIASSVNINTTLTVAPTSVTLRDKKADQLYIFDAIGGILRVGDLKNRTVSGAILTNVLAYKSYGTDIIMYATRVGAADGKMNVRIRENDKATYLLKSIPVSTIYMLDVAESDGTPYYVIGSAVNDATFVYRDPLPTLKGQNRSSLLVSAVLRLTAPKFVQFSANMQFISVQSGNKLVVYDTVGDRQFKLSLKHDILETTKLKWMDGFRFSFADIEQGYMIDFDGSNEQPVVPTLATAELYYAPNYETVFALSASPTVSGRFALTQSSLINKE